MNYFPRPLPNWVNVVPRNTMIPKLRITSFVRYGRQDKWRLLITTDLTLSFVKAFEIYQIRWTTEVLYKECRQYLRFGEYQGTDFDGMIADVTLTFLTHTMLTLNKRFQSYETFGEIFRETQIRLLESSL